MRARSGFLILGLLLTPTQSWAHLHKAGVAAGYAWNKGSTLNGFQVSGELDLRELWGYDAPETPPKRNWWNPLFRGFADLGASWGKHGEGERTQAEWMLGVRAVWLDKRVQPSLQLGYARVRTQDSAPSVFDTASGLELGAAVSVGLGRFEKWFVRVQCDKVFMGDTDLLERKFERWTVGLEVRILRPKCPKCP